MTDLQPTIAPPGDDRDCVAFADLLSMAFCRPAEDMHKSIGQAGHENVRLLHRGADLVAGLMIIPMGQWFGGRSVPTAGIAGVAVTPHERGRGVARDLMANTLREMRERGCPLSTLFPATVTLYRRCGYEIAGGYYSAEVDPSLVGVINRTADLQPITAETENGIESLYRRHAAARTGYLDRGPYIWRRVRRWRGETVRGVAVTEGATMTGYAYYFQKAADEHSQSIEFTDLVATTPNAGRRLLTFIADHRSLVKTVTWRCPAADPLFHLLPERPCKLSLEIYWMLRILDVAKALTARGYPAGLEAEVHFEIADDLIEDNGGRFVLAVAGGEGQVHRGGDGRLKLDIRGLAALYSGHLTVEQLCAAGYLEGEAEHATVASAVFAGPAPAMTDPF